MSPRRPARLVATPPEVRCVPIQPCTGTRSDADDGPRGVNRDRGEPRDPSPPTPPYIRVRIRRFGGLCGRLFPQEGRPPGFGMVHRRGSFGPCVAAPLGFTFQRWRTGRKIPVFCRMAPSRCTYLLSTSTVQAFGESLRLLCPLLTSPPRSRALRPAQSGLPDTAEISRGKIDRLRRTPAGFTTPALDGRGLRDHLLARPAG